jgi:hypothetical protein
VSPVKYELGFYILEDDIIHSHRCLHGLLRGYLYFHSNIIFYNLSGTAHIQAIWKLMMLIQEFLLYWGGGHLSHHTWFKVIAALIVHILPMV